MSHRIGMSIVELMDKFPNEQAAREWFESTIWEDQRFCGHCGSISTKRVPKEKPMPYWCKDCRKYFSVKTGTPMQSSKIPLRKWAIGLYLMTTSLKGVSSMKLHRDLGMTQSCAWHMGHRIREAMELYYRDKFEGPTEVDETYMGGKEKNKHSNKKLKQGRGATGKTPVVGIKDRKSNMVTAKVVESTDRETLHSIIKEHTNEGAEVFTDEHKGYTGMVDFEHATVKHSVGEYVDGKIHTNSIESFWSMLKRGHKGTYHQMSTKHLWRYVNEFMGRYNIRNVDTEDQMKFLAFMMCGKVLTLKELTKE